MSDELGQTKMPWMTTKYGWVFMGYEEVTEADYASLDAYLQSGGIKLADVNIDRFSLVGRWDPWWTAKIFIKGETTSTKMGGLGSHTYEVQKIGQGVEFMPEDKGAVWHFSPDMEYTRAVIDYPKTGRAFHKNFNEPYTGTLFAGPDPESEAAEILGEGAYAWDEENSWWVVV